MEEGNITTQPPRKNNSDIHSVAKKMKGPDKRRKKPSQLGRIFDRFSGKVTVITGSPWAFIVAFLVIIVWAVSGPIFHYSDTWQLVINTGTTIVTFLMVFVIQQSQNKDTMALQMKLNELIASNKKASNRLIDVEDLTEDELVMIKDYYIKLSSISKKEKELQRSHSIEELETSEIEQTIEENEPREDKQKKLNPGKNANNSTDGN
ncbi:Low affinity Fe/Cu permease [Arachidicoccus rhizosphaerae]|uniref:Low affinity Fe/Cu permease n=1 Tax=Arachidicoccus rhizosphaerae TaxID=551991 RepID=A0A1H3YZV0_9BACT|nr:low affinity iron permease family protein [Arachidicoccus rhizosphaerae]SEA16622.1 Low affinity Fe/Cu permease [Arachidicoccus rhizosphaerae]